MNRPFLVVLLSLSVYFVPLSPLFAADPPRTIFYQGRLTNDTGVPLNGSFNMDFALCATSDCSGGSDPLVTESHTGISVNRGVYSVYLGSNTAGGLPESVFDRKLWLEVTIDGTVFTPRTELSAMPYSFNAYRLNDIKAGNNSGSIPINNGTVNPNLNADLLDGLEASQLDTSASDLAGTELFASGGQLNVDEGSGNGLDADLLDGNQSGNSSGDIPISNGTLNTNLNADLLDGNDGSFFKQNLADVLTQGNSAGSNNIDMNSQNMINVNQIGAGISSPGSRLDAFNDANSDKEIVFAEATQTSTTSNFLNFGVVGKSTGPGSNGVSYGVFGLADPTSSFAGHAVHGKLGSSLPTGISGNAAIYGDGNGNGPAGLFVNGNVGIGLTTPNSELDIGNQGFITFHNDDGDYFLGGGNTPDARTTGTHLEAGSNPGNGEAMFVVESSGGSERFAVEHNGAIRGDNNLEIDGFPSGSSFIDDPEGINLSDSVNIDGDFRNQVVSSDSFPNDNFGGDLNKNLASTTITTHGSGSAVLIIAQSIFIMDGGGSFCVIQLQRDGTELEDYVQHQDDTEWQTLTLTFVDNPSPGTHTYELGGECGVANTVQSPRLTVLEIKR